MKGFALLAVSLLLAGAWVWGPVLAADKPPADAAAIWTYITKTSPYAKWKVWPDYAGMQKARSPHGAQNKVFVNPIGFGAKKPPMPYGTIQVKESFNKGGKLLNIAIMYKSKGYNPAAGDWFWALYSPSGEVLRAGKHKGCIGCHGVKADNDYVTTHTFK
ncbi:MAG: cytochrome P460 family protein [Desulfarculaceae bacterium]|jgi:hypothetical protein